MFTRRETYSLIFSASTRFVFKSCLADRRSVDQLPSFPCIWKLLFEKTVKIASTGSDLCILLSSMGQLHESRLTNVHWLSWQTGHEHLQIPNHSGRFISYLHIGPEFEMRINDPAIECQQLQSHRVIRLATRRQRITEPHF